MRLYLKLRCSGASTSPPARYLHRCRQPLFHGARLSHRQLKATPAHARAARRSRFHRSGAMTISSPPAFSSRRPPFRRDHPLQELHRDRCAAGPRCRRRPPDRPRAVALPLQPLHACSQIHVASSSRKEQESRDELANNFAKASSQVSVHRRSATFANRFAAPYR